MRTIYLILSALFGILNVYSQTSNLKPEWKKLSLNSSSDKTWSVLNTSDFGMLLTSNTGEVIKINSNGKKEWEKTFANTNENILSVETFKRKEDLNDKFLFVSINTQEKNQIKLIRLNHLGDTEWEKKYTPMEIQAPMVIKHTTDNGYILAAKANANHALKSTIILFKFNKEGDIQWKKEIDRITELIDVVQKTNQEYFLIGNISDDEVVYKTVIKNINKTGEKTAEYIYDCKTVDVEKTNSGNIALIGHGEIAVAKDTHFMISEINHKGEIKKQQNYILNDKVKGLPLPPPQVDNINNTNPPHKLVSTSDNGYLVVGNPNYAERANDSVLVVKISNKGEVEWDERHQFAHGNYQFYNILKSADGGYMIAGNSTTNSNQEIVLLNLKPAKPIQKPKKVKKPALNPSQNQMISK
ncbi:hypothetical protein [Flavobacterium sp. UBA7680]|uniref:hypothetical protein n=1 Tax=Flavobacterium sp. UBA7680 TaxID=1946559 RepID=UPI0025C478E6|nr:hypothetical protein [Flavobacterium sp. UBA7680]